MEDTHLTAARTSLDGFSTEEFQNIFGKERLELITFKENTCMLIVTEWQKIRASMSKIGGHKLEINRFFLFLVRASRNLLPAISAENLLLPIDLQTLAGRRLLVFR